MTGHLAGIVMEVQPSAMTVVLALLNALHTKVETFTVLV